MPYVFVGVGGVGVADGVAAAKVAFTVVAANAVPGGSVTLNLPLLLVLLQQSCRRAVVADAVVLAPLLVLMLSLWRTRQCRAIHRRRTMLYVATAVVGAAPAGDLLPKSLPMLPLCWLLRCVVCTHEGCYDSQVPLP